VSYRVIFFSSEGEKLEGEKIEVISGKRGRWEFLIRVEEGEIAAGGGISIFCEVPKFWLGINLQKEDSSKEEYCWVETSPPDRAILSEIPSFYKRLTWAKIIFPEGLKKGEEVKWCVGTEENPVYVVAHKYRRVFVSIKVDWEGRGRFYRVWPPLVISVIPDEPVRLVGVVPSVVRKGEKFSVGVRWEDVNRNICEGIKGEFRVYLKENLLKRQILKTPGKIEDIAIEEEGDFSLKITGHLKEKEVETYTNPIKVLRKPTYRIYWGDCHCHTGWSDGIGSIEENILFAKFQSFLDVFGFTEHLFVEEEYTPKPVDKQGSDWVFLGESFEEVSNRYYKKGEFVTLLGYEYSPTKETPPPTGDHCIYTISSQWWDLPVVTTLPELVKLCRERGCLCIPHVGGRTPLWENYPYDEEVITAVEICSMHGHFEWFAQQGLQRGYHLGFVGMSDTHFGMPGYDNWALHGRTPGVKRRNFSVQSPLTAFLIPELSREWVFHALRKRKVYATTGVRVWLDFRINGRIQGETIHLKKNPHLYIEILGTSPISRVDIIRGDKRLHSWEKIGKRSVKLEWEDKEPIKGETYYYLRIFQEDFSLCWSSPIWVVFEGKGSDSTEELPAWNAPPEWPPLHPESISKDKERELRDLLEKRELSERFRDLKMVGVFEDNRGLFSFFRGWDVEQDKPIHIHHYFQFPDGRLYISLGWSDYGQFPEYLDI